MEVGTAQVRSQALYCYHCCFVLEVLTAVIQSRHVDLLHTTVQENIMPHKEELLNRVQNLNQVPL